MSSESKPAAKKASKPRRDDLPAISASRLRALRAITPLLKTITIELGERTDRFVVDLAHTHFPNGGGWSYFICPSCARLARTLRLLEGRLVCRTCDGLLARCQLGDRPGESHGDKRPPIERLLERLDGKVTRRAKLTRSLRRKLIAERERRLGGWKG